MQASTLRKPAGLPRLLLLGAALRAALCALPGIPDAILAGLDDGELTPMRYAGLTLWNDEIRDWAEKNILPLPYAYETPMYHQWDRLWRQSQPGANVTAGDVVLMTQGSPERLPFIRATLLLWNGPASVAIFIPYPHTHPDARKCRKRVMLYLHKTRQQLRRSRSDGKEPPLVVSFLYGNTVSPVVHCNLTEASDALSPGWRDEGLWEEQVQDKPYLSIYDADYPTGTMRQLAMQPVPDSKFVFLLDADFVTMDNFAERLTAGRSGRLLTEAREAWEQRHERQAVVIPAFEHVGKELNDRVRRPCAKSADKVKKGDECWLYGGKYDIPATKKYLERAVDDEAVLPFYEQTVESLHFVFVAGHGCYSPRRAMEADAPYTFEYTHPCEPYVVGLKGAMPAFDERWRGREMDKVNYITHMAAWGTKFTVDTDHFIMHLPHKRAVPLIEVFPTAMPRSMAVYPFYRKELPFALTRVFFSDIARQPQAKKSFLPWVPEHDMSKEEMRSLQAKLSGDTRRPSPDYDVSPWQSGLPYCILGQEVGVPEAQGVIRRSLHYTSRRGCVPSMQVRIRGIASPLSDHSAPGARREDSFTAAKRPLGAALRLQQVAMAMLLAIWVAVPVVLVYVVVQFFAQRSPRSSPSFRVPAGIHA